MKEFHKKLSKSRTDLESQSLEASTTAEAVTMITNVQLFKRNLKMWEEHKDLFRNGQNLLERQRYQFPNGWLYSDNVDGELSSFKEILNRKNNAIQKQVNSLLRIGICTEKF